MKPILSELIKSSEPVHIELLFDSVEEELARQWSIGRVPDPYRRRPVKYLRTTVTAWWQLHHESAAAMTGRNRTAWQRSASGPTEALEGPTLTEGLIRIRELIKEESISEFRKLHEHELSAIALLALLITYYITLDNQPSA